MTAQLQQTELSTEQRCQLEGIRTATYQLLALTGHRSVPAGGSTDSFGR
jgi:hypothetical protein